MTPPTTPDLFAVCALGAAGLLLGTFGLLTGGVGTPRRALLLGGLFAAVGGAAWLARLPGYAWLPFAGLAPAWGVFALCRTSLPERACYGVTAALRSPRAQAAALALASASLLGWQSYQLDSHLKDDIDSAELALELGCRVPELEPIARPMLTDTGRSVRLFAARPDTDATPFDGNAYLHRRKYERKLIETGAVDSSYNCHGWIFAAGRAWVRGEAVPGILADNGYREVPRPVPGDLAVYRDGRGEVMHTALVRHVGEDGSVLLESKWGRLGRYLHTRAEHIYKHHGCTWHRSPRSGHALRQPEYLPRGTPTSTPGI